MSALRESSERLAAALARLDAALSERGGQGEGLRAAVEEARAENQRLQALAREAADRLDGTIARLEQVMKDG